MNVNNIASRQDVDALLMQQMASNPRSFQFSAAAVARIEAAADRLKTAIVEGRAAGFIRQC